MQNSEGGYKNFQQQGSMFTATWSNFPIQYQHGIMKKNVVIYVLNDGKYSKIMIMPQVTPETTCNRLQPFSFAKI